MGRIVQRFVQDEDGATAIEYALVASLMAIMAIAAFRAVGTSATSMFFEIDEAVDGAVNGGGP